MDAVFDAGIEASINVHQYQWVKKASLLLLTDRYASKRGTPDRSGRRRRW